MKRVLTFTMDIDTKTHKADISSKCTEDGIEKTEWNVVEAMSVISALSTHIRNLAQDGVEFLIKTMEDKL